MSGNYQSELFRLSQKGIFDKMSRDEITHIQIAHDDWCNSYQGKPCNCSPDVIDPKGRKLNVKEPLVKAKTESKSAPLRIFRDVERFHNYRDIYKCHEAFRSGTLPVRDPEAYDRMAPLLSMHIEQLYWHGVPTFFVHPQLLDAVVNTTPPETLDWRDMPLPFPSAVFVLPRNNGLVLNEKEPTEITWVEYARIDVRDSKEEIRKKFFIQIVNEVGTIGVVTLSDEHDRPQEPSGVWAFGLVINLLCAMAARPEYVESGRRVGTHKKSGSEIWTPNIIGRKYAVKRSMEATAGSHASPRMHWRRGHFRHQPFGYQLAQTKVIWIEPMLING